MSAIESHGIVVTKNARFKIRELLKKEPKGMCLRLAVQGGGCSGFDYVFSLDEQHDDDTVVTLSGFTDVLIVIDPHSLPFLKGSTVDYKETLGGSGFKLINPNATGTCGCGSSFSVD